MTSQSKVPINFILDLHAFESRSFEESLIKESNTSSSHLDGTIGTISFAFEATIHLDRVDAWVRQVLWEKILPFEDQKSDFEILRMKGIVSIENEPYKIVLQGVRELYDKQQGAKWDIGEEKWNRIVFIGKNLDRISFRRSFERSCIFPVEC